MKKLLILNLILFSIPQLIAMDPDKLKKPTSSVNEESESAKIEILRKRNRRLRKKNEQLTKANAEKDKQIQKLKNDNKELLQAKNNRSKSYSPSSGQQTLGSNWPPLEIERNGYRYIRQENLSSFSSGR